MPLVAAALAPHRVSGTGVGEHFKPPMATAPDGMRAEIKIGTLYEYTLHAMTRAWIGRHPRSGAANGQNTSPSADSLFKRHAHRIGNRGKSFQGREVTGVPAKGITGIAHM